jgi:hypothetical protein
MAKNRMISPPMSTYTPKVLNDTPPEVTCPPYSASISANGRFSLHIIHFSAHTHLLIEGYKISFFPEISTSRRFTFTTVTLLFEGPGGIKLIREGYQFKKDWCNFRFYGVPEVIRCLCKGNYTPSYKYCRCIIWFGRHCICIWRVVIYYDSPQGMA